MWHPIDRGFTALNITWLLTVWEKNFKELKRMRRCRRDRKAEKKAKP
jgi:hypothetical protein